MKPELLVSRALARKGRMAATEVEEIAVYAKGMRAVVHTLVEAFVASEEYARGGCFREFIADVLASADDAIEDVALDLYGDDWKAKVREGLGLAGVKETRPTRKPRTVRAGE